MFKNIKLILTSSLKIVSLHQVNEVLVLLPDTSNKLLVAWRGPFKVLERKNRVNYVIDVHGSSKQYHANLLKKYYRRAVVNFIHVPDAAGTDFLPVRADPLFSCNPCVISEDVDHVDTREDDRLPSLVTLDCESVESYCLCPDINETHISALTKLLNKFQSIMTPLPGCTDTVEYDIELKTSEPIRSKFPVPVNLRELFDNEVDNLLKLKIIQPSRSPYSSPVVMVQGSDGTYRMTIDYRALNSVTVFQAEPPCLVEEDLHKFSGAKFFSELDLSRAYYQIKLTTKCRRLTAFPTRRGLMEFVRLPFGLVNACSAYAHLMRIVLEELENVTFYFDNIFVFGDTFDEHLNALSNVFIRLEKHGLTVKPSKCHFGFPIVNYLGFVVGLGEVKPQDDKIAAITKISLPETKKTLRSFLGLTSFYRKFIPNAATITASLTTKLKKGSPEHLTWSEESIRDFNLLVRSLSASPVLKLPDVNKRFVLRSDASSVGIGAVLLQYHDDVPHPVAYASRQLLDRETRYSTIEREFLAVVWSIHRFRYYLLGANILLEIDHKPLIYLQRFKGDNSRLMRWALCLQSYNFQLVHIAGCDNVGADSS